MAEGPGVGLLTKHCKNFKRVTLSERMVSRLPLLLLLCLSPGLAYALGPAEPAPKPPVSWVLDHADVTVHLGEGEPTIEVTTVFRRIGDEWQTVRLIDNVVPQASSGPVSTGDEGTFLTLDPAASVVTATLSGVLSPDSPDHAVVHLPPGARTVLHLDAPGLDVEAQGSLPAGNGRLLPADGTLDLSWRPHVESEPEVAGTLVRAESSTAAWVQDGALNVRARIRYIVTRGSAESLSVDVSGLEEIEVEGPVAHTLAGSTLTLTPSAAIEGMLTVEITGRRSAVSGPFPSPTPLGVSRLETWYTLGKPDEGDVVPSGGSAVSARQLPMWARGLSDSAPVAYWSVAPTLTSGQFEAMLGPDTIVQSAEYVVTQSEDGHVLARATWLVRNERSQYLKVTPPKGYVPLTARVSGRPALLLHEGADYFVPLEKSIETVQGLLAFPVEVAWIGADAAWAADRHAERSLQLPAVNAPIQAASWEVHLPRGWKVDGKQHARRSEPVPEAPPLDPAKEQAREAWTNAIESYKKNDFQDAQRWLDASRGYAEQTVQEDTATMDNVGRLQSNLDVLLPSAQKPSGSTEEDVLARRVRDLANAKTMDAQLTQSKLEEDARKALLAGDDEKAAAALEKVTKLAEDIGVTEQKESNEQADKLSEYSQTLADTRARVEKKSRMANGKGDSGGVIGGVLGGSFAGASSSVSSGLGGLGTRGSGEGGGGQSYETSGGEDYDGDAVVDDMDYDEPVEAAPEEPAKPAMHFEEARKAYRDEVGAGNGRTVDSGSRSEIDFESLDVEDELVLPSPVSVPDRDDAGPVTRAPSPRPAGGKSAPMVQAERAMAAPAPAPPPPPPVVAWAPAPASAAPAQQAPETGADDGLTDSWAADVPADAEPAAADAAEPAATTMTSEFLSTIPTGRSYQESVSQAAGVVASTPASPSPTSYSSPRAKADAARVPAGSPQASGARQTAAHALGPSPVETESYGAGALGYLNAPGPTWTEHKPEPEKAARKDGKDAGRGYGPDEAQSDEQARIEKSKQKVALEHELREERAQSHAVASRTKLNRNLAPDTRERRNPLAVDASPLTPALPLDGARLDHTAALIEAGEFPTFTYNVSPDPKSDTFKE